MDSDKVIIALGDQFSGVDMREFILRHNWKPETEFHVAYVIDTAKLPHGHKRTHVLEKARRNADLLVKDFSEVVKKMSPKVHLEEHVLLGRPADELIKFAASRAASLIVMGSRGRTGIRRLLLGSVSGDVANKAHCSVVILKKNHLAFATSRAELAHS